MVTQNAEGFIRYNYTIGDLSDGSRQHKILTVNNCGDSTDSNAKIMSANTKCNLVPSEIPNGYTTGHLTSEGPLIKTRYHMYRYNLAFPINNLDPSNLQNDIDKNSKYPYYVAKRYIKSLQYCFPSFSISRNNVLIGDKQLQCPNNRWFSCN